MHLHGFKIDEPPPKWKNAYEMLLAPKTVTLFHRHILGDLEKIFGSKTGFGSETSFGSTECLKGLTQNLLFSYEFQNR